MNGMGNGRTAAEYLKFLRTPFWIALSKHKRRSVRRCERCGSRHFLQAHHRFYPDDWFRTTAAMLEVLCRSCHQREHGITPQIDESQAPERAFIPTNPPRPRRRRQTMAEKQREKHRAKKFRRLLRQGPSRYNPPAKRWVNRGSSSN